MPHLLRLHLLLLLAVAGAGCWNGVVRISGEVVDADTGAPLDDVRIQVRTARMSPFARDFAAVSESEERVSSRFRVGCWHCRYVGLRFHRPGYHEDVLEVGLDAAGGLWRDERSVRVALRSSAGAVRLEEVAGLLQVGVGGVVVLPVALGPQHHAVPLSQLPDLARRAGQPDATAHVRLVVSLDAGDMPEVARRGGSGASAGIRVPVAPRLDFGPDGGAIPYTPRERRHRAIQHEMREAPPSGYARELPLDVLRDGSTWFFCRIAGRYCRGEVNPVIVAETSQGQRAEVHVTLAFNPDGSRNLDPID